MTADPSKAKHRAKSQPPSSLRTASSIRLALLAGLALLFCSPRGAHALDLLGRISLATQSDVAKELELSPRQQEQLGQFIQLRESAALALASQLRGAAPAERRDQIAAFRRDTEKQGLSILSPDQQEKLHRLYWRSEGPVALGDPLVQERLELTGDQKNRISRLLEQRDEALREADKDERLVVEAKSQRELLAVLADNQRGSWEELAPTKEPAVATRSADAAQEPMAPQSDRIQEPKVSSTEPATPLSDAADLPGAPEPDASASKSALADTTIEPGGAVADSAADSAAAPKLPDDGKMQFSFKYQPWEDVLDWFAEQAGYSLVMDAPPPGTFNYIDARRYTPAEAIDLLNSVLLTKGYTLIRRERMLMVVNLEDGIPPNLVPSVPLSELDQRGEYELISVLFPVRKMTPEEAEAEISKMLGPQGSVVVMPLAGQIQVTETAGRLRAIRRVIDAVENPDKAAGEVRPIELKNILAVEALPVVRQLLGMGEEENTLGDGDLRLAVDPLGSKILVRGKQELVDRVAEILRLIDIPGASAASATGVAETPQLEVYSTAGAEPNAVLKVLQTLLAGDDAVRLDVDPVTGNLVALARPYQHRTIRATIDQMQQDGQRVEVIQLNSVDPQTAVLAINKLFGVTAEKDKPTPMNAPKVDADLTTRKLFVRASGAQIEQIRGMLLKMGEEGVSGNFVASGRGAVRLLPLSGSETRAAMQQLQLIWPTLRENRIRVSTPSMRIPEYRLNEEGSTNDRSGDAAPESRPGALPPGFRLRDLNPRDENASPLTPSTSTRTPDSPDRSPGNSLNEKSTSAPRRRVPVRFANQLLPEPRSASGVVGQESPGASSSGASSAAAAPTDSTPKRPSRPGAEIFVIPGPGGTIITSEDLEALDDFEDLLSTLAGRATAGRQYAVFYLKYAPAAVVGQTLSQIFGGGGGEDAGGGGLINELAGAALGGGGGMVSSLLGLDGDSGGAVLGGGSIEIVPDARLNALLVKARGEDLDLIERLLRILDQEASPEEVQVASRPKVIQVVNTSANDIANVVRQVYADRMSTPNQQRQPSPEDFIRALRGGRGGRGGRGSNDSASEVEKMSLGVDARNNSLIVRAPQSLFEEVESLVRDLDQTSFETQETMRIVSLKQSNVAAVQEALSSIVGAQSGGASSSRTGSSSTSAAPQASGGGPSQQEIMQRRMEFFQRMQQFQQRGGRRGGGGPGGGRGGGRGR